MCFAAAARGTLRPDGTLVLAPASIDAPGPAAARLAHLLAHLADGLHHYPAPDVACALQVEQAIAAEVRGITTELAVWRELDLPGAPFRFADAYWAAPPDGRDALVEAQLRAPAGPDELGELGELDGLVRDYADRCARTSADRR